MDDYVAIDPSYEMPLEKLFPNIYSKDCKIFNGNPQFPISLEDQVNIMNDLILNQLHNKSIYYGLFFGKPELSNIFHVYNVILGQPVPKWIFGVIKTQPHQKLEYAEMDYFD